MFPSKHAAKIFAGSSFRAQGESSAARNPGRVAWCLLGSSWHGKLAHRQGFRSLPSRKAFVCSRRQQRGRGRRRPQVRRGCAPRGAGLCAGRPRLQPEGAAGRPRCRLRLAGRHDARDDARLGARRGGSGRRPLLPRHGGGADGQERDFPAHRGDGRPDGAAALPHPPRRRPPPGRGDASEPPERSRRRRPRPEARHKGPGHVRGARGEDDGSRRAVGRCSGGRRPGPDPRQGEQHRAPGRGAWPVEHKGLQDGRLQSGLAGRLRGGRAASRSASRAPERESRGEETAPRGGHACAGHRALHADDLRPALRGMAPRALRLHSPGRALLRPWAAPSACSDCNAP
mmetsp:Transcript_26194/g.62300  ORF Transcript_26194/g.62300 Transcript_26194/m.62300 type:complete len:343 (-) Transcript_26194:628-1656(-)